MAQRSRRLTSPNFHCFLFLRIFSLPCAMGAWMGIFSMSRSLFLLWVFTMPAASLRTVMGDDGSMDPGGLYYRWIWPGLTPGSSISQQSQHTAYYTFQSGTYVNMFLERGYNMVQCGILLIYISVLLCPHWLPSTDLLVLGPSGHQIPHRRLMVVVYPALAVVAVLFLALLLVAMRSSQRNEPLKRTMTRRTSIKERWFFLRKWRISRVIIFFRVRVRPS